MTNDQTVLPAGPIHHGMNTQVPLPLPSSKPHLSFVIRHPSFLIRVIASSAVALSLSLTTLPVAAASAPSPQEILASVRLQQAHQQIDLQGQLREGNKVIPFRLSQNGPLVRYTFSDPYEALLLRLGKNDSTLEEITEDGAEKIRPAQFDRKVRGTVVTYEDLALKFLYWTNARVTGEENIRTRNCWKLELKPPSRQSQYSNVFLWVDKEGGALMRLQGYDWSGRLSKRFEVVSAQKIEDRWFLKQMRIEEIQPDTGKIEGRTYLEIKK